MVHPDNFIIYKTMLGDQSDKIEGIKGLGPKTLLKLFPEILDVPMSMQDIFDYAEDHLTEHQIYARVLFARQNLLNHYKLMDLKNPILDDRQIDYINGLIKEENNEFHKNHFIELYEMDGLAHFIKNVSYWATDTFFKLSKFK
jgi:5'-3' exonuclease